MPRQIKQSEQIKYIKKKKTTHRKNCVSCWLLLASVYTQSGNNTFQLLLQAQRCLKVIAHFITNSFSLTLESIPGGFEEMLILPLNYPFAVSSLASPDASKQPVCCHAAPYKLCHAHSP